MEEIKINSRMIRLEDSETPEPIREALRILRDNGYNYALVAFPKIDSVEGIATAFYHNAKTHETAFRLIEKIVQEGRKHLKLKEQNS